MSGNGNPINFRPIEGTCLFRSSQPEDGSTSSFFKEAGIKTILDLRSISEVKKTPGCADYRKCVLQATTETPELKPVTNQNEVQHVTTDGLYSGVHVISSLVDNTSLVKEAGIKRFIIYLAFIIDLIFGSHFARSLMVHWVLNKEGDQSLLWVYKYVVDTRGPTFSAALRLLAEPSHVPAVVACSLGKDRTGVTCLFVGHMCGQSEEQLIQEYAKSAEVFGRQPDHYLMQGADRLKVHKSYKLARKDTMAALIEHIKYK